MKKIILFVLVMNSLVLFSFSHQDSLIHQFEQTPRIENDDFIKALLIVYEMSDNGYHNKTQELSNILLDEATQSQSLPRQALSYFLLAYDYKRNSAFTEALAYYEKSLAVRKQMNDFQNIAKTYSNMSNIYYDMGNYSEALSYQKKSLSIRLELNDQVGIAINLSNIGNILSDQKQYNESSDYYRKSLKMSLKTKDSLHLSNVLVSLGHTKYYLKEYDSAHYYYNRSLSYSLPSNKYSACYAYRGIGTVFTKNKQFDRGEYFIRKSLAIAQELDIPLEITLSQLELAQLYLAAGKNVESIALFNQTHTTSREINFTKGVMKSNEFLSQLYEKTNDYEQALKHHIQYKTLSDSLSRLEEKKTHQRLANTNKDR